MRSLAYKVCLFELIQFVRCWLVRSFIRVLLFFFFITQICRNRGEWLVFVASTLMRTIELGIGHLFRVYYSVLACASLFVRDATTDVCLFI